MNFFDSFAHYLIPRHSNNHKAKVIHTQSLLFLSLFLIVYQFALNLFSYTGAKILGYAANISTDEVIRLTNAKRSEAGVAALKYNPFLAQAAHAKGEHMLRFDYWAHVAPDGTEPWKFFTDVGYKYRYAGENLARDFSNPSAAVDAWMVSPTHKENLLSSKYSEIGVAVVEGDLSGVDTTLIVQFFGAPLGGNTTTQVTQVQAKVASSPTPNQVINSLSPTLTLSVTPGLSITPTTTPTQTPTPTQEVVVGNVNDLPPAQNSKVSSNFLFSPFETTKGISLIITGVLLLVLFVDIVVIASKRIPRVSGRTFAHMAFFGMVLAIVLIIKAGKIL